MGHEQKENGDKKNENEEAGFKKEKFCRLARQLRSHCKRGRICTQSRSAKLARMKTMMPNSKVGIDGIWIAREN